MEEGEGQEQGCSKSEKPTESDPGKLLQFKIQQLEDEKIKIREEFNLQRAKMKELFLQKENELARKTSENVKLTEEVSVVRRELDDVKSQLVIAGMTLENDVQHEKRKANEEIASLQQLVHETIEESSSTRSQYDHELRNLQAYIQKLRSEILALKQNSPHHSNQEPSSLAPSVVLNALTKGIAKKLGADSFTSQDSLGPNEENSGRSRSEQGNAQEDTEVLSLIGPLEDQIQALKEKLRATDEQLQKCKECGHFGSSDNLNASNDSQKPPDCDMCSNYEAQLVKEQQKTSELETKVKVAEKAAERHKEDLLKEIGFRKEMEEKWNEKKEEHKQQVAELTRSTECAEQDLKELRQNFDQTTAEIRQQLSKLSRGRERIQEELLALQRENDKLVGKYTISSQQFQSEAIDLPNTVEELHELVLRHHQDLIIAKIGKEAAEDKANTLQSDILLLRDQITNDQHERESLENSLVQEISALKSQKHQLEKEKKAYLANQEKLETSERSNGARLAELQQQVQQLSLAKKQLTEGTVELSTRIMSLQKELDTSEQVQKDFVRLSQSLQVQLEKIRESDTQVRWQHEEDANQCPNCQTPFSGAKRKEHCRHCGQIFCQNCLGRTVESGAHMLPSKVCDVCHTLLVKSSAPYFSEAPPQHTN